MNPSPGLEITVRNEEETPIIELVGKVCDADVKKFQRKLDQFYKKKSSVIMVDVSRATFMDSHGLGTVVYYHTLMQKERRKLVLINTNNDEESYLNKLFALTNLDKVLAIETSVPAQFSL